jgi:1-acyl-sn-glycerol-3-phosphate acyltransferase
MVNLGLCGVEVDGKRRASLDPTKPYVFMSNHASHFDVLAVVAALPEFQLRWVAKKELADIPIFGWAMRRAGHVIIDRSNPEQALGVLARGARMMDTGISVMIFPEGTREGTRPRAAAAQEGRLRARARDGAPIVPIAVRNSRAILPRDDWHIRSGTMTVVVGEPIPVEGQDRETLVAKVEAVPAARARRAPAPAPAAQPQRSASSPRWSSNEHAPPRDPTRRLGEIGLNLMVLRVRGHGDRRRLRRDVPDAEMMGVDVVIPT